MQVDWSCQAAK